MTRIKSILMCALLSLTFLGVTSCDDSFVYEKEGDCTPKLQFVFKKHRQALHSVPGKEADVFYSTVESVHVFVYDAETGELVFEKTEKTENLKSGSDLNMNSGSERCYMPLDIPAGTYRIVAWCGLDENDRNNAFALENQTRANQYTHCKVQISAQTGQPVNNEKYESLYHGVVNEVTVRFNADDTQIIPIELTKNNNDIAIWIQHTTKTFEKGEYEVVYTDANGTMKFEDNTLTDNSRLEYRPHTTSVLTTNTEYNGSTVETGAMVAHLSTSRLMAANQKDARIEVRKNTGEVVYSIPFIKYVLQMQTLTDNEQYYLDCEDTYNCSFYLTGDDGTWMPARIIINNWVVVPGQTDTL